ncbi:MAG: hypothetical protein ACLGIN_03170 [Candidatus Sericytochromatia bacterium]
MRRWSLKRVTGGVIAAGRLIGCAGQAPATAPAPPALQEAGPARQVLMDSEAYGKRLSELMARLALSEAQKEEVKGVIQQAFEIGRPMMKLFKALVADPAVDQETLAAGMKALILMDAVQDAQTMASLRGVLTAEQRQVVAEAIPELLASRELNELLREVTGGFAEKLELSASQREKFDRMMADFESFWKEHEEALLAAMAKHMTEGGQLELQKTFEAINRRYDTDSLAAFLASLDRSQRRTLNEAIDSLEDQVLERL